MENISADQFMNALRSDGSLLPEHAQIFAPFIGSWDLAVTWFDGDGNVSRTEDGEWHFSRVLDGRGIQDVWIVPPRSRRLDKELYEYGTSVRFYDPTVDAWQSIWIGPLHGLVKQFVARKVGSDVVLETPSGVEPATRWTFHEIELNSFKWKNEINDETIWRTQQTFHASRRLS